MNKSSVEEKMAEKVKVLITKLLVKSLRKGNLLCKNVIKSHAKHHTNKQINI